MRKTFEVEALKNKVNGMIRDLPDSDVTARIALQTLIENVLMETKNYNGFSYLNAREMTESRNGTTVGINEIDVDSVRNDNKLYELRFANTDHTRVNYF